MPWNDENVPFAEAAVVSMSEEITNNGTDSLCACATASHDIGRAAAAKPNRRRVFGRAGIAQRHVTGATFVLRVDELHVRPPGDGVADGERRVREYAEDFLYAS
jgi:hypothetical protein